MSDYTSMEQDEPGNIFIQGFDEEFDPPAPDVYECPICLLVLRMPMQTECGHRFCKGCILKVIREGRPNCPIDNEKLSENQIFPDNFARREILSLNVRCQHSQKHGCIWHGSLRDVEKHMSNCDYSVVECPNKCELKIQRKLLNAHIEKDCPQRTTRCEYCDLETIFRTKQAHYEICYQFPLACPNNCNQMVPRDKLLSHMEVECPNLVVNCCFKEAGCLFQGSKSDVTLHESTGGDEHMRVMMKTIVLLSNKVSEQDAIIRENKVHQKFFDSDQMELDMVGVARSAGNSKTVYSSLQEGKQSNKSLEIKMSQLQTVTEMCRSEIKQTKVEMNKRFEGVESKITDQNNLIAEISARVWCGKFIWRITGFDQYFKQAKNGDLPALHSQPFYTGVPGYKMCLRVNLNGIDSGEGTHVSMFVHLMQGEFDNIVSWPFSSGLELTIMDQDQHEPIHIKEELFARPSLQAFLRPKTPRNHKGYGYVEMITHRILTSRNYLHNDTMVVKVEIKNKNS